VHPLVSLVISWFCAYINGKMVDLFIWKFNRDGIKKLSTDLNGIFESFPVVSVPAAKDPARGLWAENRSRLFISDPHAVTTGDVVTLEPLSESLCGCSDQINQNWGAVCFFSLLWFSQGRSSLIFCSSLANYSPEFCFLDLRYSGWIFVHEIVRNAAWGKVHDTSRHHKYKAGKQIFVNTQFSITFWIDN